MVNGLPEWTTGETLGGNVAALAGATAPASAAQVARATTRRPVAVSSRAWCPVSTVHLTDELPRRARGRTRHCPDPKRTSTHVPPTPPTLARRRRRPKRAGRQPGHAAESRDPVSSTTRRQYGARRESVAATVRFSRSAVRGEDQVRIADQSAADVGRA